MAKRATGEPEQAGPPDEAQSLAALEAALGHTFATRQHLIDALTHRSYAYEFAGPGVVSNERLEFLGDAVIALVASDLLFVQFPAADEGMLTQYRAALVRASTLAQFAEHLHLGAYLRLGRGEAATGGRTRQILLASAFEAVVGALYLDGGMPVVHGFLEPLLVGAIERLSQTGGQRQIKDDKSLLQELAQGELGVTPRYRVVGESGPSHERRFEVEVLLGDVVAARGKGRSKRQAEQDAAHAALAQPGWRELAEARLREAEERVLGDISQESYPSSSSDSIPGE